MESSLRRLTVALTDMRYVYGGNGGHSSTISRLNPLRAEQAPPEPGRARLCHSGITCG